MSRAGVGVDAERQTGKAVRGLLIGKVEAAERQTGRAKKGNLIEEVAVAARQIERDLMPPKRADQRKLRQQPAEAGTLLRLYAAD